MSAWIVWAVVALVLLGVEVLTLDLVFASLAVGAVAGSVAAALSVPVAGQIIVAVVVALGTLFLLRPAVLRRLHGREVTKTNVDALVGRPAIVLERVDHREGRVKVGGEVWSARTLSAERSFDPGDDLVVVQIDGATALVERTH